MALKLGAYTACLHDRPLGEALEVLKGNGLTSVEVNTGGFIPSPHCHVDLLLSSEQARADYLGEFSSRGMELTGLNCNAIGAPSGVVATPLTWMVELPGPMASKTSAARRPAPDAPAESDVRVIAISTRPAAASILGVKLAPTFPCRMNVPSCV